jgi:ribosomal-protein-alanine N-acetyltransferase
MLPLIITTSRLVLRPYRDTDLEEVLRYATDPQWAQFLPVPQPYERAHGVAFLTQQVAVDRTSSPSWAITADGLVIGGVDVSIYHTQRRASIGYSLSPKWWGRGLATEAAQAVVDSCFASLDWLNKIAADADAENSGSLRVMEKIGMQREGLLRKHRVTHGKIVDVVACGMLREEWESRRS